MRNVAIVIALAAACGCAKSQTGHPVTSTSGRPTAATSGGGTTAGSGSGAGTTGASTASSSTGSSGTSGASCTSQTGACSASASCCTGMSCQAGRCQPDPANGCGPSSVPCNGTCVVTRTDPRNCGGCGITCAATEVCTAGGCHAASSCPQGTVACQGSCIDPNTSSAHCGGCPGSSCPAGQGCSGGACVPTVALDGGAPASCAGGGPPVYVAVDGGQSCAGTLAQVTFRWGLCSCTDVALSSLLTTDGFDSASGPYVAGGLGAGLGVNQAFDSSSRFDVGGTAWFAGTAGPNMSNGTVRQDLWSGGPVRSGDVTIFRDAHVDGDVTAPLRIGGKLDVPASATVAAAQIDGGVVRGPVSVPPPCDCAAGQLIDVAGIVRDGAVNNQNGAIGLAANALESPSSPLRLDLPCGRYYLTRIHASADVAIVVHGRTALFVGGDVQSSAQLSIVVDPQAELDLFIGGTLVSSSGLSIGSTEVPAQTRVYIAGQPVALSSNGLVAANLYLPGSQFATSSDLDLYGSVFCGSYQGSSKLDIHFDTAVLTAGTACGAPQANADGGVTVVDAGSTGGGCSSCRDCGNQACNQGTCGPCATSADCCAPLVCLNGSCQPTFR